VRFGGIWARRRPLLVVLPLLLVGGLLVPSAQAAGPPEGPDVSTYQHDNGRLIDWGAVRRSGQSFAFIKATGGSSRVDPWFTREWAAAGRAGIIRGAYHYADPRGSADAQAALVVRTVGTTREDRNLGIALDLEDSGGLTPAELARWAHAFLDGVERRTGRLPVLYTYVSFWQDQMAGNRTFGAYPLWLARYGPRPAPLPGWSQWTFWQHSSTSRLPGIPGYVDHNVMCCSAGTLAALADGRSSPITALWRRLGGASGVLGLPLGPEQPVAGGWAQTFQRGMVATTRGHGTFPVLGQVYSRYAASGGATGALGVPVGNQQALGFGVVQQVFAGGRIVSSSLTGAHALRGPVLTRWLRDGGVRSQEGLPRAEAAGVGQQFTGGGLYRTSGGVRLVPGAIRDRYEELGGPSSVLGLPAAEAALVGESRLVRFDLGVLTEVVVGGQHLVL
jgi:lysozyme